MANAGEDEVEVSIVRCPRALVVALVAAAACGRAQAPAAVDAPKTDAPAAESRSVTPARLVSFEDDGRYGYRDEQGRVVLPAQYFTAEEFNAQGVAAVTTEDGPVWIDASGKELLRAFLFDNGHDYFEDGVARYVDQGKVGFCDAGAAIVIPAQFDFVRPFSGGLALFCQGCAVRCRPGDGEHCPILGGVWGYVDRGGRIAIAPTFEFGFDFEDGSAEVHQGGKRLRIDTSGRVLEELGPVPDTP